MRPAAVSGLIAKASVTTRHHRLIEPTLHCSVGSASHSEVERVLETVLHPAASSGLIAKASATTRHHRLIEPTLHCNVGSASQSEGGAGSSENGSAPCRFFGADCESQRYDAPQSAHRADSTL
jgi:hypothetical protein